MARTQIAKKTTTNASVVITFTNGKVLEVALSELAPEIVQQLAIHGLSQKLGDSYASCEGNADHGYAMASAVAENLKTGQWAAREKGGLIFEALAAITGKPIAEVITTFNSLSEEQQKAVKKSPDVQKKILELKQERLGDNATTVDLGNLF